MPTLSAGETDRDNRAAAMQRRSGSQNGECREKPGATPLSISRASATIASVRVMYQSNLVASRDRLTTMGSLGSCPESSLECRRLRWVFPDAAVISASSTTRTLCGARPELYRGERCAGYGANRATSARARPTRAGRSAGGANEVACSFGEL